jgi:hypothetical protein
VRAGSNRALERDVVIAKFCIDDQRVVRSVGEHACDARTRVLYGSLNRDRAFVTMIASLAQKVVDGTRAV